MQNKYSDSKIIWFPDKLKSFKDNIITPPIYVRVKPTNRCNHKCVWCVYHPDISNMHPTANLVDELSFFELSSLYKNLYIMGVKATTLSGGGEPLLHPFINDLMRLILNLKIDLSIITNGSLLKEQSAEILTQAKWIRISVNYNDYAVFNQTRKGTERGFKEIVENIQNFAKIKPKTCDLSINYIIDNVNFKQIYQATKFYKELGIEIIRFSPVWYPNFIEYHSSIKNQVLEQLERCKDLETDNFKIFNSYHIVDPNIRIYNKCFIMQTIPVVAADGNVYACHNKAYDPTGLIGSIKNQSFSNLWFSDQTKNKFDSLNPEKDCCHQCANDHKNILIHNLLDSYGDNFV